MTDKKLEGARVLAEEAIHAVVRITHNSAIKGKDYLSDKAHDLKRNHSPVSEEKWYLTAAESCEAVSDAILGEKPGASQRIVKVAAGKLGAIGVPAVIFSMASLLGTASTGTAIGTLSGAAFTSAALAWIGGSMAMGSMILGVASVAGGVGAVAGAGLVAKKLWYGAKRDRSELDEKERKIVDACLSLSIAFRNQEQAGQQLDPTVARALYHDALKPLCDELLEYKITVESWPYMARQRLYKAVHAIENVASFTLHWSKKHPNLSTGIVGAVLTQLLADDIPDFDANEQLVLDALRRANSNLSEATDQELAEYVQSLDPSQMQGLSNLLIGVSHELRYYVEENNDGDQYIVELFEATNHPGADVIITNTLTGDVEEYQLKATNYLSYIKKHNERYGDIPVLATDEVASASDAIQSTGIAYEDLEHDVDNVLSGLDDVDDPSVLSSMSVAAMITLARNINVLLKGNAVSEQEKKMLIEDGVKSAIVSGLVHTIIG